MPRAGLSTPAVVAEAARLADEVGLERVTLAALADRFGVAVPSLYKHVGGADDLERRLALLAVDELGERLAAAAVGRARGDALRGIARAFREYATAHRGRYAATVRARPDDPEHRAATDAVLRTVLAVLEGYGLAGDDAVDAARTVRAALHGFVDLETSGGFGLPRQVDRSYDRLVDGLDALLDRWTVHGCQALDREVGNSR